MTKLTDKESENDQLILINQLDQYMKMMDEQIQETNKENGSRFKQIEERNTKMEKREKEMGEQIEKI